MTRGRMRGAAALELVGVLAGCAVYRPLDLPLAPAPDPTISDLTAEAVRLDVALSSLPIELSGPLTPDQLGLIAVLANPDIRAQRARLGVTEAQVFDAGLLPDPQFSFSLDHPVSSAGLVNAVAAGLGLDTSSLYARPYKQRAARASREQVRLDVAWQEWQVAGKARLLAARVQGLVRSLDLARNASALSDSALQLTLRAVARGDRSASDLEARRLAAADASDRARTVPGP